MATKTAGATVVDLQSTLAWARAQRRSRELAEAMRRHPCYQARLLDLPREPSHAG
ncbi:hypothetical protein [Mycolicibacterium sp.]|uniref:hypothetical protein n=1 Tax=Mycolicibacterium sp. TaxID=2320850 RepID=UPI003D13DD85